MGPPLVGVGQGVGPLLKRRLFFVRAPPPDPLRRGVVPLTGYRGMSHALFFRLRESSNPRPKGHIEMGSTLTTNWASSLVGSESAPHFNMSLWSWVRALTEVKEKGMGHAPIACEWDHPSLEWARRWGPYKKSSPVGSESAPHFNMSLWSWVRTLTEAKEKGMGHAPIACEWDHPSSEWARGWGPYKKKGAFFM